MSNVEKCFEDQVTKAVKRITKKEREIRRRIIQIKRKKSNNYKAKREKKKILS